MKLIRRILGWILILFFLFSVIPYGIGVSLPPRDLRALPFPESSFAVIAGTPVHYRLWQPEGDAALGVLFVHGLGGSTFSWEETARRLQQEGYLVMAVDLPGFGYSSRDPAFDHSQENRARLLWGLLDEFGGSGLSPTTGWVLAGHSMGGGTVAAMAMERPRETKGLILAAGALFDNNPGAARRLLAYPPLRRWLAVVAQNILLREERLKSFLASAYGRPPTEAELAGYFDPLKEPGTALGLAGLVRRAKSRDPAGLLSYEGPSLAIWGEDDAWVRVEQIERIRTYLPRLAAEIIPGAAHVPMETHPEEFNLRLLSFLSNLTP